MLSREYHEPLTCSDLKLNQERVSDEQSYTASQILTVLTSFFGRVQCKHAVDDGLYKDLLTLLHGFAQGIANEISSAYVTEALERTRESTANMFEALAAGASFAHKTARQGEDTGAAVHGLATIAASLGRPTVLDIETKQKTTT